MTSTGATSGVSALALAVEPEALALGVCNAPGADGPVVEA